VRNQTARNQTVRNHAVRPNQQRHPARRGFTLLELLVAIVVISILAAFLLPAIQGVIGTGRVAAVRNEISQLEAAIANFKAKYGVEPPSFIRLYESGTGDPSWETDTSNDALRLTSRAIIQRIWPNFDFKLNRDINGDHDRTGVFDLCGPECLVFFLGGVYTYAPGADLKPGDALSDDDGNGVIDDDNEYFYAGSDDTVVYTPSGFGKNPANPFVVAVGQVAEGPFFEFHPSRLKQSKIVNGFFVYFDSIPGQLNPYIYFNSREGRGYSTTMSAAGTWRNIDGVESTFISKGYMQRAYYQSISNQVDPTSAVAHKPKSYQIISPGADYRYGVGGVFNPDQPNGGLSSNPKEDANNNGILDMNEDSNLNGELDAPVQDYDNITNLASGRLVP
jgi:prepilin-type N-terminal cleavage/methylation domain-containing protein